MYPWAQGLVISTGYAPLALQKSKHLFLARVERQVSKSAQVRGQIVLGQRVARPQQGDAEPAGRLFKAGRG